MIELLHQKIDQDGYVHLKVPNKFLKNSPSELHIMLFSELKNQNDYQQTVNLLNSLIDIVDENENHPLVSIMDSIGLLIAKYEQEHVPEI